MLLLQLHNYSQLGNNEFYDLLFICPDAMQLIPEANRDAEKLTLQRLKEALDEKYQDKRK